MNSGICVTCAQRVSLAALTRVGKGEHYREGLWCPRCLWEHAQADLAHQYPTSREGEREPAEREA